tara:strand:- start:1756 stop:2178 length:423 start_codon:yes stop_codon:yes gene_type:complete
MKGLVFFMTMLFPSLFMAQSTADLTVQISNIKNNNGLIQLGLYNDASKFPMVGRTFRMVRVKTKENQKLYTFKNLPKGTYALAIYHDENANKTCDTNFFGIPKEAYAFSNGIRPRFSAPSFGSCSFILDSDKAVKIKLVY